MEVNALAPMTRLCAVPAARISCVTDMEQGGEGVEQETLVLAGLMIGVLGFQWTLHRDIRNLSDRVARLEGLLEGLLHRKPSPLPDD